MRRGPRVARAAHVALCAQPHHSCTMIRCTSRLWMRARAGASALAAMHEGACADASLLARAFSGFCCFVTGADRSFLFGLCFVGRTKQNLRFYQCSGRRAKWRLRLCRASCRGAPPAPPNEGFKAAKYFGRALLRPPKSPVGDFGRDFGRRFESRLDRAFGGRGGRRSPLVFPVRRRFLALLLAPPVGAGQQRASGDCRVGGLMDGAGPLVARARADPAWIMVAKARPGWLHSARWTWVALATADGQGESGLHAPSGCELTRLVVHVMRTSRARAAPRRFICARTAAPDGAMCPASQLRLPLAMRCAACRCANARRKRGTPTQRGDVQKSEYKQCTTK